ncbi:uncharacterized protein LOC131683146 [Topomyia yanbarensis]|uniref:uncharacterized protein LOC131683146 n=1 Tax=Topomyia yanbarensis TaxID=2498891 RepID=UPI00273B92D0|nr:uncharacterized protein LOC131683146 [Topomyia yanbarensis]
MHIVINFEEFYTVLTQIEAVLNSRPLFANSLDTHEPSAITPGHFLIGRALVAIPEPTLEDASLNRLTRWKYLQSLREHFWRRWSIEYLNTLQARSKWIKGSPNVVPKLIVLIKEDNLPPQSWKLAVPSYFFRFNGGGRSQHHKTPIQTSEMNQV